MGSTDLSAKSRNVILAHDPGNPDTSHGSSSTVEGAAQGGEASGDGGSVLFNQDSASTEILSDSSGHREERPMVSLVMFNRFVDVYVELVGRVNGWVEEVGGGLGRWGLEMRRVEGKGQERVAEGNGGDRRAEGSRGRKAYKARSKRRQGGRFEEGLREMGRQRPRDSGNGRGRRGSGSVNTGGERMRSAGERRVEGEERRRGHGRAEAGGGRERRLGRRRKDGMEVARETTGRSGGPRKSKGSESQALLAGRGRTGAGAEGKGRGKGRRRRMEGEQ